MKFAEAIGALLFNGNGWANTSLIQSNPLHHMNFLHTKYDNIFNEDLELLVKAMCRKLEPFDLLDFEQL